MSKYIEFNRVPFTGKTKKYKIISKVSYETCNCASYFSEELILQFRENCSVCKGTGKAPLVLGRISWYAPWRQYTFSSNSGITWNKDCLKTVQDFLQKLMNERKIQKDKDNFTGIYSTDGVDK